MQKFVKQMFQMTVIKLESFWKSSWVSKLHPQNKIFRTGKLRTGVIDLKIDTMEMNADSERADRRYFFSP